LHKNLFEKIKVVTMKAKYRFNKGLAFAEKTETRKLETLASQGWIFKRFALGGFLYRFEQGPKKELSYSMDFHRNPDDEYFDFVKSASWEHLTSYHNQIHVFSAPKGTAPIYSGNAATEGKYDDIASTMKTGSFYSLIAMLLLLLGMTLSQYYLTVLYLPLKVAFSISVIVFVFFFLPYCQYKWNEWKNK
jgi:hypothetical protein